MDPRRERLAKEWMSCTIAVGFVVLLACSASNLAARQQHFFIVRADVDAELALLPFSCNATNLKRVLADGLHRGPIPVKWHAETRARIQRFEVMFNHLENHGNDSSVDLTNAFQLWPCLRSVSKKLTN